MLSKLARYC